MEIDFWKFYLKKFLKVSWSLKLYTWNNFVIQILSLLSHLLTKPTNWHMRPAKTQISLGICPVWSESSLCAQWVAKDPSFLHADSEDTDQTGWMPRLIWVFAGRTVILLVLSWGGSFVSDNSVTLTKSWQSPFMPYETRHEKTCLWGLWPGKTQMACTATEARQRLEI